MVGPVPGISAHSEPIMVPRIIGKNERFRSARLGHMSRTLTFA